MCQFVCGASYTWEHFVEGQSASRPVQIHSHSGRARGGETYVRVFPVVPGRVTIITTFKTPRLGAVIAHLAPGDSSVCHNYQHPSFPNYLPVTAASQALSTQHLSPGIRSLWVIRIVFDQRHLCVPGQRESSVGRVWVQCEITGI